MQNNEQFKSKIFLIMKEFRELNIDAMSISKTKAAISECCGSLDFYRSIEPLYEYLNNIGFIEEKNGICCFDFDLIEIYMSKNLSWVEKLKKKSEKKQKEGGDKK